MRALRICRRCRKRLAEACVCDAMAASQLRGRLIPMADARKRRVSAVEPMKLGLAEAARPLSAAHWVRGMDFAFFDFAFFAGSGPSDTKPEKDCIRTSFPPIQN
jgi:hypothetical protein